MKTFNYKKYKNCYFFVGAYNTNEKAMYLSIENETEGSITACTAFVGYAEYDYGIITIKNYAENSKITNFLKKLGIISEIKDRFPCNFHPDTLASLNSENPQTIDLCKVNIEKLKNYSKEWYYNYEK